MNEEKLLFRKAREEDVKTVAEIYESVRGQPGSVWNELYPIAEDAENDFKSDSLYVLTMGGEVIGTVSAVPEDELDEFEFWHDVNGAHKEIARIAISRKQQGHGYAKIMVGRMLDEMFAVGYRSVRLTAAVRNAAACKTYHSLGFNAVGECDMYGNHYIAFEKLSV